MQVQAAGYAALLLVAACASGCTVASVGGSRGWWNPQTQITSCEEGCLTWSADGQRCIRLRNKSFDDCTVEQLRGLRR